MLWWGRIYIVRHFRYRYSPWWVIVILIQTLNVIGSLGPLKVNDVLWSCPPVIVNFKALTYELFVVFTDFDVRVEQLINPHIGYLLEEHIIIFVLPRSLSVYKLEGNDPHCPYITFVRVPVILEWLRWHVERRTHVVVEFLATSVSIDGKPEICQHESAFPDEDVC